MEKKKKEGGGGGGGGSVNEAHCLILKGLCQPVLEQSVAWWF